MDMFHIVVLSPHVESFAFCIVFRVEPSLNV